MSNFENQIEALKKQYGFRLARQERHCIWKSRDGWTWVTPSTLSDNIHGPKNMLQSLKRAIREAQTSDVLAITDFEREQAAAKIAGAAKQTAGRAGSAGQKKSRGTGVFYIDTSET